MSLSLSLLLSSSSSIVPSLSLLISSSSSSSSIRSRSCYYYYHYHQTYLKKPNSNSITYNNRYNWLQLFHPRYRSHHIDPLFYNNNNNNNNNNNQYHQYPLYPTTTTSKGNSNNKNNHSHRFRISFLLSSYIVSSSRRFILSSSSSSSSSVLQLSSSFHSNVVSTTSTQVSTMSSLSTTPTTPNTTNNNAIDHHNRTILAQYTNNIQHCGRLLRYGQLVAFPTETVYGLGGDATNLHAVKSIYTTKERPYNDPLIVHVLFPYQAYTLWYATSSTDMMSLDNNNNNNNNNDMTTTNTTNTNNIEQLILKTLCETFWPGPLTIVAKATPNALLMTKTNSKSKQDIQQQLASKQTTYSNNDTSTSSSSSLLSSSLEITNPVLYYVTANTGYIAIRSPRHPIARAIIQATSSTISDNNNNNNNNNHNNDDDCFSDSLPIVAPSANKFGHVSPTLPQHVYTDFLYDNITIYNSNYNHNLNDNTESNNNTANNNEQDISDTNDNNNNDSSSSHTCDVGVESTVVKVETILHNNNNDNNNNNNNDIDMKQHEHEHEQQSTYYTYHVTILRQGAISLHDIKKSLQNANLLQNENKNNIIVSSNIKQYQQATNTNTTTSQTDTTTKTISKMNITDDTIHVPTTDDTTDTTTTAGQVAPGQSIRHYSPNIPSYLISHECSIKYGTTIHEVERNMPQIMKDTLKHVVIIDYGQQLYHWSTVVLQYYDLSYNSNSKEAAYQLFQILRQAEIIPNVQFIYYPQYVTKSKQLQQQQDKDKNTNMNIDNRNNNENMITIGNDTNDKVEEEDDALTLALQDRLTRAASGIVLYELPYQK